MMEDEEELVDRNKLCIICCCEFVLREKTQDVDNVSKFCEEILKKVGKGGTEDDKNVFDFRQPILELEERFGMSVCLKCSTEINELEISKEKTRLLENHVISLQMEILKGLRELKKCVEKMKCLRTNIKKTVEGSDELSLKRRLKTERRESDCFAFKLRQYIMKDGNEKERTTGNEEGRPIVKVEPSANDYDDQDDDDDNTSNICWNTGKLLSTLEIKNEENISRGHKSSSMTLRTRSSKRTNRNGQEVLVFKNVTPSITKGQSPEKKKRLKRPVAVVLKKEPNRRTQRYCDLCPFNTREEPSYEQHMLQHENETDPQSKSLECPVCPSKFSTQQLFVFHQRCHQGLYKMCCDVCSKMIPVLSLADHLKSHFPPKDLKNEEPSPKIIYCENCSFCCSTRQTYLGHLRRHFSKKTEGKFSCDLCSEQFTRPILLLNHFHDKHEGTLEKWKCDFPDCDKIYNCRSSMVMHKLQHSKEKIFQCPNCTKIFKTKNHLDVHSLVHSDEKPHSCNLCDQSFRWKTGLVSHQRRDHGAAKLNCKYCDKEFCEANRLRGHVAKLHENKGLPCEICGKTFGNKDGLRRHVEAHQEEKRFTCETCGKGFKMEDALRNHTKLHSGVKNWKCECCGKAFARRENLRAHLRIHTGERPFVCDICGKDFNQASALKTHKKNQHPI